MKKSLTLLLSLAMVFTMFASVAFAADSTTTTPSTQDQYNALVDAGIMTGTVVDGQVVAGLDMNMDRGQYAEVLVNLYNLPKVATSSSFTDVPSNYWAMQQIEAVKAAGYMVGNGDGTFNPTSKITLEQVASVITEVNGLSAVPNADISGADDWAKGYIAAALQAGLLAQSTDYTQAATRSDLVNVSYAQYQTIQAGQKATASFAATGADEITVTFNKAIDDTAAFTVKKGSIPINLTSTTPSDDNMSVVLKTTTKLTKGKYTITGTNPDVSGTVDVTDEAVTKIEFTSDKAPLDRDDATIAYGYYKLFNQYGDDVTSSRAGEITLPNSNQTKVSPGVIKISNGTTNFVPGTKIAVSIFDSTSSVATGKSMYTSQLLTVSTAAHAATVTIDKLVNTVDSSKTSLTAGTSEDKVKNYALVVSARDQYGNPVTADDMQKDIYVSVSPVISDTVTTFTNLTYLKNASGDPAFGKSTVDGKSVITLPLDLTKKNDTTYNDLNGGTSRVTMYVGTNVTTFDVSVTPKKQVKELTVTAPDIAVLGEKFNVPFTATDQFGNAMTKASDLIAGMTSDSSGVYLTGTIAGVSSDDVTVKFVPDYVAGKANLTVDTTGVDTAGITNARTLNVSGYTGTMNPVSFQINLQPPTMPAVVTGVTSDTKLALGVNATTTITDAHTNVLDKYSRAKHVSDFTSGYDAYVKTSDSGIVSFSDNTGATSVVAVNGINQTKGDGSDALITSAAKSITLTGVKKGSATITITLIDAATGEAVPNSSYSFTERVVGTDSITDYTVADIGTMYVGSGATADYDKTITVTGLLDDGTEVALKVDAPEYYTVTSDTYVGSTTKGHVYYTNDGSGKLTSDHKFVGDDATVPVTVVGITKDGTKVVSKTVTVSDNTPVPATIALSNKNNTKKEADNKVSITEANAQAFANFNELGYAAVKITDQYGETLTSDATHIASVITSNLPSGVTAPSGLKASNEFDVTVITSNGLPLQFHVIIN